MELLKIYVGGEFVKTNTELIITNKYNQKPVVKSFLAGAKELDLAIEKADLVKEEMKNMPSWKKYEVLTGLAKLLTEQKQRFADFIAKEAGKPMKYALGEVDRAIQTLVVSAEEAKRLKAEYFSVDWTKAGEGKEAFIKHFPVGLVAGISPFNFPLNLAIHKVGPAIAAGCPIILKPARSTAASVLAFAELVHETSLPKGAFSVLPMDREAGNQLVTDPRFDKLSFTGSPAVGWKMKSQAGKKKITLELGGNAGCIVSETADIDKAVAKCLVGGFAYSGQVCIHVQRIYVHKNVFEEFSKKFAEQVKQLKAGDPMDPHTDISVLIDEANAIRVEDWVNEAVEAGAELICGGKRNGAYMEPTVLGKTKSNMKVCAFEVFGPVVTLNEYEDYNAVLAEVNDSDFGLQAGVFTDSNKEIEKAFNTLDVGGVIINDVPTFRVDHMPYGGVKNSGFGREGVKYAIMEMQEPKLMVKSV